MNYLFKNVNDKYSTCNEDSEIYKQIKEADEINKELSSETSLPLSSTSTTLLYTTHPQAVYTSRLLDYKNLPEPNNANDNDDNSLGTEYSGN